MSERIESWLSSLDRELRGSVADVVREARVAEMRGHLHLSIQDLVSSGLSIEDAETEALRNLGSPLAVAGDFVRQARGFSRKSIWLLAWFPMVITVLPNILFLFNFPQWQLWTAIWIAIMNWSGVPVYLAFAWQVWRTRRWLAFPVALVPLAMMFVAVMVYKPANPAYRVGRTVIYTSAPGAEAYRVALHDRLAATKLDLRLAKRISSDVSRGGHAPSRSDGYLIPSGAEFVHVGYSPGTIYHPKLHEGTSYSVIHASFVDQAQADGLWRDIGEKAVSDLGQQVVELENAYAKWQEGPPFSWEQFMLTYGLALVSIGAHFVLLLAVNWFVLRLSDRGRRLQPA